MGGNGHCCSSSSNATIISAEEALRTVLTVPQPLPPVTVPLNDAWVKSWRKIYVSLTLCLLTLLLLRGYAVVASDGPGEYPVITESRAGNDGIGVIVTPGTVAYVTTGGPIPDSVDAVVQVEDTEQIKDTAVECKHVKILIQTSKGADIRPVGCYIEKDAIILRSGERIGASEIGYLLLQV